ncbi:MAG: flagellar basal-body rod protein FlgF [Acidobacteriia bacterium]|nr:flagellar basal-body rod protein FlgF [Terriglobia bacterium]
MDSGYYAACAGLIARTDALDVAANNLANINTTAYKGQREHFRSLVAGAAERSRNPLTRAVNDFGVVGGTRVDFLPGNLERTGNDLDLGIEGSAFFSVQTKNGIRYTRDGHFSISSTGELVTAGGDAVLGDAGKINLPAGPVSISSDGTISSSGAVVAKLKLVEFPNNDLIAEGASYFTAPPDSAKPAKNSAARQGVVEASNVNPVAASVGLIMLQRNAEMLQRALSVFYTDFNRAAVEDLPRVS